MTDKREPSPIADALASYLRRSGIAKRIQQAGVIEAWPDLVGPQIASVTAPDAEVPDLRRKSLDEVTVWNPAPEDSTGEGTP
jgi:hypothetical protein